MGPHGRAHGQQAPERLSMLPTSLLLVDPADLRHSFCCLKDPAAPWPGAFPCHLLQSEKQSKTPSFFSLAPLHSPPLKGERATASESPSSNGRARRQGPRRTLCRPLCRPVRAGRMAMHQSTQAKRESRANGSKCLRGSKEKIRSRSLGHTDEGGPEKGDGRWCCNPDVITSKGRLGS